MTELRLSVRLAQGTPREEQTREQLLRVLAAYDVSKWLRAREIVVEEGAVPHSHPTLTLNTRHIDQDEVLLSTFVHEQLHWHLSSLPGGQLGQPAAVAAATEELRTAYPDLPVTFPEGAGDAASTYLHVIVNYLESTVMQQLLDETQMEALRAFWLTDHYTEIYRAVLAKPDAVALIVERHGLAP